MAQGQRSFVDRVHVSLSGYIPEGLSVRKQIEQFLDGRQTSLRMQAKVFLTGIETMEQLEEALEGQQQ